MAGMGGELIARLLGACSFAHDPDKRFVLQPMTRSEQLIKWLCENGFDIEQQDCCVAAGKCYTAMSVRYTGNVRTPDELYGYTGRLNPRENGTHLLFLRGHIDRLRKQAKGDARFGALAARLEAFCDNG